MRRYSDIPITITLEDAERLVAFLKDWGEAM